MLTPFFAGDVRSSRRGGLTLVELLAVIAIIGLLVALLMPAIQSARETSRRTTCNNNLKQMALAGVQHLEQFGTFPSGGWVNGSGNPNGGFHEMQWGGWLYNITPFMELQALRDNPSATRTSPTFTCPTTMPPGQMIDDNGNKFFITSYSGCQGSAYKFADWCGCWDGASARVAMHALNGTSSYTKADRDRIYPTCSHYPHRVSGVNDIARPAASLCSGYNPNGAWINGVIGTLGRVRAAHVTDGFATTIMFGERPVMTNNYTRICDTEVAWSGGVSWGTSKSTGVPPRMYMGQANACEGNFGSRHADVFGVAFCDGSVRSLSFSIDSITVWPALGSRNVGEIINDQ
jgi:prepilin-type N-terminal cleavage/methylation domain-containing protein